RKKEGGVVTGQQRPEIIDSDGHVVEPDSVWKDYAEPAYREQLDYPGGGVQRLGMSRAYPDAVAPDPGPDGAQPGDHPASWATEVMKAQDWDEASKAKLGRPGGYDPKARLIDMDAEGIDRAVLYPTSMLTWVEEADLFAAACRAYNNWLHDYCGAE